MGVIHINVLAGVIKKKKKRNGAVIIIKFSVKDEVKLNLMKEVNMLDISIIILKRKSLVQIKNHQKDFIGKNLEEQDGGREEKVKSISEEEDGKKEKQTEF